MTCEKAVAGSGIDGKHSNSVYCDSRWLETVWIGWHQVAQKKRLAFRDVKQTVLVGWRW